MTKTLKLDEKDALRLYPTASPEFKSLLESNFGKEFFNQKITDKVHDIETLCEYLGIDEDDLFIFKKNTKNKHERYINACNILPKIAEVYNEGTVLDWKNTNVYKHLPYLYFSGGSCGLLLYWCTTLHCPVGFYYKSDELSKKSYENFQTIFEDFWGLKAD